MRFFLTYDDHYDEVSRDFGTLEDLNKYLDDLCRNSPNLEGITDLHLIYGKVIPLVPTQVVKTLRIAPETALEHP